MAWSDSGQVTQSILGIKGLEEQKKSNRWAKLMDIANVLQNTAGLGADIWKTVSGRKHDFALASVGQGYNIENREDEQLFTSEENALDRTFRTGEREAGQVYATGERVAGQEFQANQNLLDRQLSERLENARAQREEAAKNLARSSAINEWIEKTWEAVLEAPEFLDPATSQFNPEKKDAVKKFLLATITGNPELTPAERDWATSVFNQRIDALLPSGSAVKKDVLVPPEDETPAAKLKRAQDLVKTLVDMNLPKEADVELDKLYGWLPALGAPGGRGPAGMTVDAILKKLENLYNIYSPKPKTTPEIDRMRGRSGG